MSPTTEPLSLGEIFVVIKYIPGTEHDGHVHITEREIRLAIGTVDTMNMIVQDEILAKEHMEEINANDQN